MIQHSLPQWPSLLWILHLFSNTQGQTLGAVTARQDGSSIVISVADLKDTNDDDLHFFYSTDAGKQWAEISKDCLAFEGAIARWDVLNCLGVDTFEETRVQFKVLRSICAPVRFDGYVYRVVQIGSQCWFAENLRTTSFANGDQIPGFLSDFRWYYATSAAQAFYDHDTTNLSTYGRLYNWFAVDDSRGLCPDGWRIPTDEEWMLLEVAIGMSPSEINSVGPRGGGEGVDLKAAPTDNPQWNGKNTLFFTGAPGGCRYLLGNFSNLILSGYWWSSTSVGDEKAWSRSLSILSPRIIREQSHKNIGYSVRCLSGQTAQPFEMK